MIDCYHYKGFEITQLAETKIATIGGYYQIIQQGTRTEMKTKIDEFWKRKWNKRRR